LKGSGDADEHREQQLDHYVIAEEHLYFPILSYVFFFFLPLSQHFLV
jgi:hypothetical protein